MKKEKIFLIAIFLVSVFLSWNIYNIILLTVYFSIIFFIYFYITKDSKSIKYLKLPELKNLSFNLLSVILLFYLLRFFIANAFSYDSVSPILVIENNIYTVIIAPIYEELITRFFFFILLIRIFDFVKDKFYKEIIIGFIISVVFSIMHRELFLIHFFSGIVLYYSFRKSKSIYIPIFIHFINNYASSVVNILNNLQLGGGKI
jgi:membrane protease YdiL (CAAX protease family)